MHLKCINSVGPGCRSISGVLKARGRVVVVVVLLLVAAIAAYVAMGRGSESGTEGTAKAGSGGGSQGKVVVARGEKDPATGLPRWFGASGIKGKRIAGLVLDDDGKPVAGATVRLASPYLTAAAMPPQSRQSDGNGHFDFGVYPAATYAVTAEMPKLTAALERIDLRDPIASPAFDQLRLVLHACTASIHGTVLDSAGGPIGGAVLVRTENWVKSAAGVEADENGAYELCVPAGGAGVNVSADGYAAVDEDVNVYGRTRRDFQLAPGASIVGRVVRASDKSPVAQAIVTLRPAEMRSRGATPLWVGTDEDGRFAFDAVAPGRLLVSAQAEGFATQQPVDVIAELGGAPTEVTIEVVASFTIAGKVIETGTNKPVVGRNVHVMPRSTVMELVTPQWGTSQTDGSFVVEHVVPGDYRVVLSRNEFRDERKVEPTLVTVVDKDISGIVLEAPVTGSIAGRVLYGGKGVDGASVRIGSSSTTSASDGSYIVRQVGPGTHKPYAESHLVGAFTNAPPVTIASGEDKTGVDIVLDLSASVSGVVVDQNDKPVGGVFLSFSLLRGRDFGSATTADDGSFTARSMSGGGEYAYEVKARDRSALVLPPVSGKRHPPVQVKDGQTHVTGLRIQVKYERLAISGRVLDTDGKPIVDAVVSAEPRERGWYRPPSATSDQTGAFAIRDLPAGTYTLRAATSHGEAREEDIAAGSANVKLTFLAAGGIDGTLVGFTAVPQVSAYRIGDFSMRHRATGSTLTGFQLRNLPAGRYSVSAGVAGRSDSTTVDVMPGQIAKATLELGEVGTVVGRIVDSKGAPVPRMRCTVALRDRDRIDFGGSRTESETDASGAFRVETANAGPSMVGCYGRNNTSAWKQVEVAPNAVTNVELTVETREEKKAGHAGLELEDQLGEVLVKSVEANGPAARAGIAIGDSLETVDGYSIGRYQSDYAMSLIESPGGDKKTVTIVVERNGKQITVTLTLDPPT